MRRQICAKEDDTYLADTQLLEYFQHISKLLKWSKENQ